MNLLDLLFPRTCLGCGKPGQYFCSSCLPTIRKINGQICPICEKASSFGQAHPLCKKNKYSLDGLISFFAYAGLIRTAIHQLKFKYVTDLSGELFDLVKEIWNKNESRQFSLIKRLIKAKKPVITPVPLYWYKQNLRGFNQAEIFGEKLAELWNLDFKKDLLIRSKFTQSQVGLSEKERQENIADAFILSPNIPISSYPHIMVIDDVWTTGATLKACGSLLKKSGAKTVWGLTAAK